MDKERQRLINRARRIRGEIEQIFTDARYWNENVRTPFERPIDPDPDGELRRWANAIDGMLEAESGVVKTADNGKRFVDLGEVGDSELRRISRRDK